MRAEIAELRKQAAAARARVAQFSTPGPDETVSDVPLPGETENARTARANRIQALNQAQAEVTQLEARAQTIATDLANHPDAGTTAAGAPKPGNLPAVELGPRRPGQRTDLDALEAGWKARIAAWNAD